MKVELLDALAEFERDLRDLKRKVEKLPGERVNQAALRESAERIANRWVEDLRSPLEHKFKLPADVIEDMAGYMKQLHVLSRPNNRKSSYVKTLSAGLKGFKNRFVLPIQQMAPEVKSVFDLTKLVAGLTDQDVSEYLQEAIACANSGYRRAAVVMGWCAAIDQIHKKIQSLGFAFFNSASQALKAQTSGKHKRWTKEFSVTTLGELQGVFDSDLIVVLEGMSLIDGNQAQRLQTAFQYRNHSAHPGEAPIEDAHLVAFFTDIAMIVLLNPTFDLAP